MSEVWIAFITGITTGGLSCLAVQGGLLASGLAQEVEHEVSRKKVVATILAFLTSKLIAYTLLGLLLGWAGTMLQLSPYLQAGIQIVIGLFMIGMALRMLNSHPFFRYFIIEPPKTVTRFIRRYAKKSDNGVISGGFLGVLTVLIPCGVTQVMMATALATGSPVRGAVIMFAFILGTSPLFFILAYLATRLGESLHSTFTKVAAVLILLLGLVSLEAGLNLAGSPISYAVMRRTIAAKLQPKDPDPRQALHFQQGPPPPVNETNTYTISVNQFGYSPDSLQLKANTPVKITFATDNSNTCARALVVPSLGIRQNLPLSSRTELTFPAKSAGTVIRYSCAMGMYQGEIRYQ